MDMKPEHWKLLAACMRHNFRWVDKLARDYFKLHRVQRFLVGRVVVGILKRKVEPYIKMMEQGTGPPHPKD